MSNENTKFSTKNLTLFVSHQCKIIQKQKIMKLTIKINELVVPHTLQCNGGLVITIEIYIIEKRDNGNSR